MGRESLDSDCCLLNIECLLNVQRVLFADINECTQGQATCSKVADCVNSPGSYSCSCKKGFSGDGYTCVG